MELFDKLGINGRKDAELIDMKRRLARATADVGEHRASVSLWEKRKRPVRSAHQRHGCNCSQTQCGSKNCSCVRAGIMCTDDCLCGGDPDSCRNHRHRHTSSSSSLSSFIAGSVAQGPVFGEALEATFSEEDQEEFFDLGGTGRPSFFNRLVSKFMGSRRPTHAHAGERIGEASNPGPPKVCCCSVSVCSVSVSYLFCLPIVAMSGGRPHCRCFECVCRQGR